MVAADGCVFNFKTDPGVVYTIEYTDSLVPPVVWRPYTNIVGDGALKNFVDSMNREQRYFRVVR
jgi:hypothetical protein